MSFRLAPNSVVLNDHERRNSSNGCVISPNSVAFWADYVQDAQLSQRDRAVMRYSFGKKWKTRTGR